MTAERRQWLLLRKHISAQARLCCDGRLPMPDRCRLTVYRRTARLSANSRNVLNNAEYRKLYKSWFRGLFFDFNERRIHQFLCIGTEGSFRWFLGDGSPSVRSRDKALIKESGVLRAQKLKHF